MKWAVVDTMKMADIQKVYPKVKIYDLMEWNIAENIQSRFQIRFRVTCLDGNIDPWPWCWDEFGPSFVHTSNAEWSRLAVHEDAVWVGFGNTYYFDREEDAFKFRMYWG